MLEYLRTNPYTKTIMEFIDKNKTLVTLLTILHVYILIFYSLFRFDPYNMISTYRTIAHLSFYIGCLLIILSIVYWFQYKYGNFFQYANKSEIWGHIWTRISKFVSVVITLLFISFVLYYFTRLMSKPVEDIISNTLLFCIIVGAISLVYVFLKRDKSGMMYLSRIFINIAEMIHKQFKITPSVTWTVMIMETVFIGTYFLLPWLNKFVFDLMTHDGELLIDKPIQLDSETNLGSYQNLEYPELNSDIQEENVNDYNYGLSVWVYLHPHPDSDTYRTILNDGNKPIIEYNSHKNMMRVRVLGASNESANIKEKEYIIYEGSDFLLQKWNNIVINYTSGTMDLFLNNELIASSSNIMPYMVQDNVSSGDEQGLDGAIVNVQYFKHALSKMSISHQYNYLKQKDIPVI